MDYSKFYLKNYEPEDSEEKEEEKIVFPQLETRRQPEIIYINPDGEVFDPELENLNARREDIHDDGSDANNFEHKGIYKDSDPTIKSHDESLTFDNYVKVSRKQPEAKKSFLNAFCQTVLIFAIIVMSIIVSADFIADGKVISSVVNSFSSQKIEYYAVLENPKADLTSSQVDSYAMRLKGGAGFTVKNGDNYYNVFAIYENISDAENRIKQNGGEILILSTEFYDKISGDLKDYSDYPEKVCDDLTKIASQLISQEITTAQALEKINDVKEDFSVLYDNMSGISASDNDDKSLTLLANASVAMSALEYLCDTTVSRPNLVCDIRYTVCRIIFTYCYSE